MIRVGVDVGGTFTDLVLERSEAGGRQQVFTHKVSSTVADQSIGVVKGVVELCAIAGIQPAQIDALFHGTTVATNIVIERNGAEVGMITTKGFRDILHMARHKRPHNFSLQFDVPWQSAPLIKRRNRIAKGHIPPEKLHQRQTLNLQAGKGSVDDGLNLFPRPIHPHLLLTLGS